MLVVTALHNTGHGDASTTVLITDNINHAVDTTRGVERLGFQFYSNDTLVSIEELHPDVVYPKDFNNFIFVRRFFDGEWAEGWYDQKYQIEFLEKGGKAWKKP